MKLEVEQKLLQEIINYLQNQPHKEVCGFISELVQCKPPEKKPKK